MGQSGAGMILRDFVPVDEAERICEFSVISKVNQIIAPVSFEPVSFGVLHYYNFFPPVLRPTAGAL